MLVLLLPQQIKLLKNYFPMARVTSRWAQFLCGSCCWILSDLYSFLLGFLDGKPIGSNLICIGWSFSGYILSFKKIDRDEINLSLSTVLPSLARCFSTWISKYDKFLTKLTLRERNNTNTYQSQDFKIKI